MPALGRAVQCQTACIEQLRLAPCLEKLSLALAVASSIRILYLLGKKGLQYAGYLEKDVHPVPLLLSKKSWLSIMQGTKMVALIAACSFTILTIAAATLAGPTEKKELAPLFNQFRLCLFYLWPLWLVHDAAFFARLTTAAPTVNLLADLIRAAQLLLPLLVKNKKTRLLIQLFYKKRSVEKLKTFFQPLTGQSAHSQEA